MTSPVLEENQSVLRDLVRQLRSPVGIVPFIGAGMSTPFGFPGWGKFLTDAAAAIGTEQKIKELLAAWKYEEAAQALEDDSGGLSFQDRVRATFGEDRLDAVTLEAPIALLPGIATGPVVTTNFDRVLEKIYKEQHQPFDQIVKGVEIDTFTAALDLNRHLLLKVHGDAEDRTHRLLTLREYEKNYGTAESKSHALLSAQLELLAIKRPLLFLGCSLEQDRVMDVLERLISTHRGIVHYALLAKPSDDALTKRVKFLSDRGIRPIWFPQGEFQSIPIVLQYLVDERGSSTTPRIGEELADLEDAYLKQTSRLLFGREAELKLLSRYADSQTKSIQIVTATAGMGKTSLLARWTSKQAAPDIRCVYHCFSERSRLTSIRDAYLHLLDQLSENRISEELGGSGEEKLRQELYNRIKSLTSPNQNRKVIIVIDGLDEAERPFQPPFPVPLPENLRVIASARSSEPKYLEGWADGNEVLELKPLSIEAVKGWLDQVGSDVLSGNVDRRQELLQLVWQQTSGYPLYLNYLLDELLAAAKDGKDLTASIKKRPPDLQAYVRDQINRLASEESGFRESDVKNIFALLSVAFGAISEDDLAALTNLTVLDLPRLPAKVTRWFDIRTHSDPMTFSFAHPELAKEFAQVLGKLAKDTEKGLIEYCYKWPEHHSPYALEYLPDHLARAGRQADLFELARDDSYASAQAATFPDSPEASLKTVRLAISVATELDDAGAMAEFVLLHAERVANLRAESPLIALEKGSLVRAWQLADLYKPEQALVWHLILAVESLERGNAEAATQTVRRLLDERSGATHVGFETSAIGLFLPLLAKGIDRCVELFAQHFHGSRNTQGVAVATDQLAERLVERQLYDVAMNIAVQIKGNAEVIRWQIIKDQARRGDLANATKALEQITRPEIKAVASADLAYHIAKSGDVQGARELLQAAVGYVRLCGWGHLEVAEQQARLGYFAEALQLINEGFEKQPTYSAQALAKVAVLMHESGNDPEPALKTLLQLSDMPNHSSIRSWLLSFYGVACVKIGKYSQVKEAQDKLLSEEAEMDSLIGIAVAWADTGQIDKAEEMFELLRQEVAEDRRKHYATVKAQVKVYIKAERFEDAEELLEQYYTSRSWMWEEDKVNLALKRAAAAGKLEETVKTLELRWPNTRRTAADFAANLVALDHWQTARAVFVRLAQPNETSSDLKGYWNRALTRIAVVLAEQSCHDEAEATVNAIEDKRSSTSALNKLAVAYAKAGHTARGLALVKTMGNADQKQWGLGLMALEQAQRGDLVGAQSTLELIESKGEFHAAVDLIKMLKEQNALDLLEEFKLVDSLYGESYQHWWDDHIGDDNHIGDLSVVVQARLGEVVAALDAVPQVSLHRLAFTIEEIAKAAIREGVLHQVIARAETWTYVWRIRGLISIAKAQIRRTLSADAESTLKLALSGDDQAEATPGRQEILIDAGIAYQLLGKSAEAESTWRQAIDLIDWHNANKPDEWCHSLDDIYTSIVKGLVASGLRSEALNWISKIGDLSKRQLALTLMADYFVADRTFSREVMRFAREAVWTSKIGIDQIIQILVRVQDHSSVKQLLANAAESREAALLACASLAKLYPGQALKLAALVRGSERRLVEC